MAYSSQEQVLYAVVQLLHQIPEKPLGHVEGAPSFYSYVLRMPRRYRKEPPGTPNVASTDGSYFYFGEDFLRYNQEEQWAILCHETLHVWLKHPERGMDKDNHMIWNIACDYMVNGILRQIGLALPKDVLIDPTLDIYKTTTEAIYYKLLASASKNTKQPGSGNGSSESSNPGEQGQNNQGSPSNQSGQGMPSNGEPKSVEESRGKALEQNPNAPPIPTPSPTVDEMAKIIEGKARLNKPLYGDLDPYNPENEQIAAEARKAAADQLKNSQNAGKTPLPPELIDIAEEPSAPPIDWAEILKDYASQYALKRKYTYSLPAKKYMSSGLYLPRRQKIREADILVAVDESGSVTSDTDLIGKFLAAVIEIFENDNAEGQLVLFSTQIDRVWEYPDFPTFSEMEKELTGGGTTFSSVTEYATNTLDDDIDLLIMFTDMYDEFPPEPPYPVLWVTKTIDRKPPYGEVIYIP